MGRAVVAAAGVALFAGAGSANAIPPVVTISATATEGAAPLVVTFQAHGDAVSYQWQLGNGKTASGPTASATYGPGSWTASVIATAADGSTAQASVDVRSVAIRLHRAEESRYGKPAVFRGSVVPALAGESIGLYVRGAGMAATRAAPDGTFELHVRRLRTPGPYEARSPLASSRPVFLKVQPVLQTSFVGTRDRRGAARRTCVAGCGRRARRPRLLRSASSCAGCVSRARRTSLSRPTARSATARSFGYVRRRGGCGRRQAARATVVSASRVLGVRDPSDGSVVFRYYGGLGYRFQPLLSFAALNQSVSERRPYAARRIAAALLGRAVRSGDALFWEYDFSYQGGAAPWRSGFAQAVAAQALARAGALAR